MRILANENLPRVAVELLRARGHDVLWARSDMPGATDVSILERARSEGRLVVTFDKDFGELAFRWGLPSTCGVALFRLAATSPETLAARIAGALDAAQDWVGQFVVVEEERIRIRPLPSPKA